MKIEAFKCELCGYLCEKEESFKQHQKSCSKSVLEGKINDFFFNVVIYESKGWKLQSEKELDRQFDENYELVIECFPEIKKVSDLSKINKFTVKQGFIIEEVSTYVKRRKQNARR
jgi:thiamine biosynthesis lipoprotein ApbE